jgi:radical SAM protein with 4Fe4S-binding SPASM domain
MTVLVDNGRHLPELAKYIIENRFRWEVQFNKFAEDIGGEEVLHNLKLVVDEFSRNSLNVADYLLFNFCDFSKNRECSAGNEMFYIETNGNIHNCQMQTGGNPLSSIFDKNLLTALTKNKPQKPYIDLCNDCKIFNYCHGDCPINNNPKRRKYFCDIMREYFLYASSSNLLKRYI